jgi:toll-like receptor 13
LFNNNFGVFQPFDKPNQIADRKWVHEKLVPVLEEEYGHTLCIHCRDFEVGKLIVHNTVENMKESRKVILVMSNAFARSEWCQFGKYKRTK